MVEAALDSGINLIDCANTYATMDNASHPGESETILGRVLKTKRDDVVITSKVSESVGPGPNDRGSSRYHIMREVEHSLRRLQTDHIDVYLLHVFDGTTRQEEVVRALDAFVRAGGTLVCLSAASDLCIDELHLPVSNVVSGLGRGEFFGSGSIFEVRIDTGHPVMSGMPERGKVFFDRSPVFTTEEGFEGSVIASYAAEGSPLLSGYLLGEEQLQGQAAAVDVRLGEGRVILLGFRPQWRGQPRGTFRVLFNAVLFHGALAAETTGTEGFWVKPEQEDEEEGNGNGNGNGTGN